jgi:uncharacterized membrane protein
MLKLAATYGATLVAFAALDAAFLTLMGPRLHRPVLGNLLAEKVALAPAAVFYLLFAVGLVALAAAPARDWRQAAMLGALLGLVAYGTYDLTNQATLARWSSLLTAADMAWGALASAAAAAIGRLAMSQLTR